MDETIHYFNSLLKILSTAVELTNYDEHKKITLKKDIIQSYLNNYYSALTPLIKDADKQALVKIINDEEVVELKLQKYLPLIRKISWKRKANRCST